MIVCTNSLDKLSRIGRLIVLFLGVLFLPLLPAPAESQKRPALPAESKTEQAAPSALAPSTQAGAQEDAESFLPNTVPLQGQILTVGSVAFSADGKRRAMTRRRCGNSFGPRFPRWHGRFGMAFVPSAPI